jgi:hypothetical protein
LNYLLAFYNPLCFIKKKASLSFSVKAVKVAAAHASIIDHLAMSPEFGKCELEDFEIWGRKFLELKVHRRHFV